MTRRTPGALRSLPPAAGARKKNKVAPALFARSAPPTTCGGVDICPPAAQRGATRGYQRRAHARRFFMRVKPRLCG